MVLVAHRLARLLYKFFREDPQPAWMTETPRCGSSTARSARRTTPGSPTGSSTCCRACFPRSFPGPADTPSLGVPWEQGQELPIGFTKKTIGFPRVANNCAVCHTANYRMGPDENPDVRRGRARATRSNLEAFFRFLVDCAKDPRFNADNLMHEIDLVTDLTWIDRLHLSLPADPDHQETAARARERSSHGSIARTFRTGAAAATTR